MRVLALNSGSSTLKFSLLNMETETVLASGGTDRGAGENDTLILRRHWPAPSASHHLELGRADTYGALEAIMNWLGQQGLLSTPDELHAIGHRVVHGGEDHCMPVRIDTAVMETIERLIPLAPLHNRACLDGIEAIAALCPDVPQVAVFDTAFFQTLPAHAYRYAIPEKLYREWGVRRYGFHGISHQYVSKEAARYLAKPLTELRLISLHLGSGASVAAVDRGRCIDTSMGLTPLAGLVMSTRCGDIDPAIPLHLARNHGQRFQDMETLFFEQSGLKGICGAGDMREVQKLARRGQAEAKLALDIYCYQIRKYIGAYFAVLGGIDALIFTAGVGQNDSDIRQRVCAELEHLGIFFDRQKNTQPTDAILEIGRPDKAAKILVIPTDEELEIARQVMAVANVNQTLGVPS